MGTITPRKQGNKTYYYYQESYRVKINPNDSGTSRGSGKSRVSSRATYLGSAEDILASVRERREPVHVFTRHFGLIAAAYQTAHTVGLPRILMDHIPGVRCGIPRWIYFFVTIINRLDHATSKNKMSQWLKKTILPELLHFDPKTLTGKNFWYAADDVISQKELEERREENREEEDLFVGIDDAVFTAIEMELFTRIDQLMGLSPHVICYDTTNFYTYIEEPKRSELAATCHSKDAKHHLRHVGLLMAVEKEHGIPLMSRVYRANSHDSKVFSFMLADLVKVLTKLCGSASDLVLVLDKGNNRPENFARLAESMHWVGALVPSHHEDLINRDLTTYHGSWKEMQYYRCKREIMGIECDIVLTYHDALRRKQEHSLARGMEKLKKELRTQWKQYKRIPRGIPRGIKTMMKKSKYGNCLVLSVTEGSFVIEENRAVIEKRKKFFGKNLIFTNMARAETGYIIDTYHEKSVIEDDFQLLKDTTIIRFRPIRHWTDSKIRAYAFCCVVSMTLMRVMQWMTEQAGYRMSPGLLKEELADLQEVVMVYGPKEAIRKVTERSRVQDKLWNVFGLEEIAEQLLLH